MHSFNSSTKNEVIEDLKYKLQVFKTSFSIILKHILTWREKDKCNWKKYLLEKYCIYDKTTANNLGRKKTIIIFINALEILGMTAFCKTLKKLFKEHNLIIACDNFDSYEITKKLSLGDAVVFSPWDIKLLGKKIIKKFNIKMAVFVAKPFHPQIINEFKTNKITTAMVSCTFSRDLANEKLFGPHFKKLQTYNTYENFDFISMQNNNFKNDLLEYIKRDDILVLGDIRQDVSHARADEKEKLLFYSMFKLDEKDKIIIAAATAFDEEIILKAYKEVLKEISDAKLILIPRHIERADEIIKLIDANGLASVKLSEIKNSSLNIVVGDVLVELGKLYSIADIIIFARTFSEIGGNANILEPACHGKPIIFGNNLKAYKNAVAHIIKKYPQVQTADAEQLAESAIYFLKNKNIAQKVGNEYKKITKGGERTAVKNALAIHEFYILETALE